MGNIKGKRNVALVHLGLVFELFICKSLSKRWQKIQLLTLKENIYAPKA